MFRTMFTTALALAVASTLALGAGCKKDSTAARDAVSPPADLALPIAATDNIWAMAPAGTKIGIVIGPKTGSIALAAIEELKRSLSAHPSGAKLLKMMADDMPEDMPENVLSREFHQQIGVDLDLPVGVFASGPDDRDQIVFILPVADPDKFVEFAEGKRAAEDGADVIGDRRCRQIAGHYACASTVQALKHIGADLSLKKSVAGLARHLRGHIEVYFDTSVLDRDNTKLEQVLSGLSSMHGALRLERGGFAANWQVVGTPNHAIAKAATQVETTLAKRVANKKTAGFWRLSVPIKAIVPPDAASAMAEGARRVNIDAKADILDNVTGEVIMYALAQRGLGLVLEVGARDGRRLQRIIDFTCGLAQMQLPPQVKEFASVEKSGDRCKVKVDPSKMGDLLPPNLPFSGPIVAEMYTTDISLAISLNAESSYRSNPVAANQPGRDLLTGSWNLAMWGYGSFAGMFESKLFEEMRNLDSMDPEERETAAFAMWMLGHLSEMGMGVGMRSDGVHLTFRVGTQWANDDAVLRDFQKLLSETAAGDSSASGKLKALADKSPESPLGRSMRAGTGSGPVVAVSLIGVSTAVAIPAFMKYIARSKSSEANMNVRNMFNGARMYIATGGAVGDSLAPPKNQAPPVSVGPTPELGTCCADGGKCQPDATWWQHPTWQQLNFSVNDSHSYSYQYEVDGTGQNFTVRAIGDLDCDGVYGTFAMYGSVSETGEVTESPMARANELE